jgi:hypothetical protein
MKFCNAVITLASLFSYSTRVIADAHEEGSEGCTHGKLYMVDNTTSKLYVFDGVASNELDSLNAAEAVSLPVTGAGQLILQSSGSGKEVVVMYRGDVTQGYQDGFVEFLDSGVVAEDHDSHAHVMYQEGYPKRIPNAAFSCARAIHYVRHHDKIAIFCDGSYDHDPQVNSTVWVVEETKFGATESAIVYSEILQGTHHGVVIPVDDDHLLYSLAHENRTNREENADLFGLPDTFQVVDYQGNVLHSIDDTSNKDTHCTGFHGSAANDNTFALACNADHGGIVIVDYQETTETYASRALSYPVDDKFAGHRTGSFDDHPQADFIVGNFATREDFHLMAFSKDSTTLTSQNVLTLPDRQCTFAFELGQGKVVLVFMPNGFLHAFEWNGNQWNELAKEEVVPGMAACSEAVFTPGVGQAFLVTPETKTLYAVDLARVHEGEIKIYTSTLPFFPSGMIVAGLAKEYLCDEDDLVDPSAASYYGLAPVTFFAAALLIAMVV